MARYVCDIKPSIFKVAILPKLSSRVNELPNKIPVVIFFIFVEFHRLISEIYIEMQKT